MHSILWPFSLLFSCNPNSKVFCNHAYINLHFVSINVMKSLHLIFTHFFFLRWWQTRDIFAVLKVINLFGTIKLMWWYSRKRDTGTYNVTYLAVFELQNPESDDRPVDKHWNSKTAPHHRSWLWTYWNGFGVGIYVRMVFNRKFRLSIRNCIFLN